MTDNKKLIQKADWTVGDLTSEGGLLNPEQTDEFIRKLVHVQPTILRDARVVRMNAPVRKINKIGFNTRIMAAAPSSGTALGAGLRSRPTTEQVTLTTSEVIAEVRLPYDVIEDNIERGTIDDNIASGPAAGSGISRDGIKDTIMTLIAERAAMVPKVMIWQTLRSPYFSRTYSMIFSRPSRQKSMSMSGISLRPELRKRSKIRP